jgi:hypothetical protein
MAAPLAAKMVCPASTDVLCDALQSFYRRHRLWHQTQCDAALPASRAITAHTLTSVPVHVLRELSRAYIDSVPVRIVHSVKSGV